MLYREKGLVFAPEGVRRTAELIEADGTEARWKPWKVIAATWMACYPLTKRVIRCGRFCSKGLSAGFPESQRLLF
ncbi:hypothetical protein [Vreelandella populi]|uniref:hypothetical protein n=1 Tax=Vreelandella populi TaxID=2498858 RepID=UPI0021AF951F|nr:hypothetical protein [Halomonas populi]